MTEKDSNIRIGLIPCVVGGTAISKWEPGAFDEATQTHPCDDAVVKIKEAMEHGEIAGVIWHQGEANSNPMSSGNYPQKLKELITRIRDLTGNPKLPVAIGELGQYKENYRKFNEILVSVPKLIPYTAVATSEGMVDKGDGTHFDGPSAHEFGKRFAEKMKELQSKK